MPVPRQWCSNWTSTLKTTRTVNNDSRPVHCILFNRKFSRDTITKSSVTHRLFHQSNFDKWPIIGFYWLWWLLVCIFHYKIIGSGPISYPWLSRKFIPRGVTTLFTPYFHHGRTDIVTLIKKNLNPNDERDISTLSQTQRRTCQAKLLNLKKMKFLIFAFY